MADNNTYKYLSVLIKEGSFSRASQVLEISQPSLSQFVQRLETENGVKLIDRDSRPLRLTYAGQCFFNIEREIARLKDLRGKQIADIGRGIKGRVRLGASQYRSAFFLASVLPVFRERFPDIEIALEEGTTYGLEESVLEGKTDVALSVLPLFHSDLEYEELYEEKQLICLNSQDELAQSIPKTEAVYPTLPFSALDGRPFILMKKGQQFHELFFRMCSNSQVLPRVVLESDSPVAAMYLAGGGLGAAFTTETIAKRCEHGGKVRFFECDPALPIRRVVAVSRKGAYLSKAAKALISVMQQVGQKDFVEG